MKYYFVAQSALDGLLDCKNALANQQKDKNWGRNFAIVLDAQ